MSSPGSAPAPAPTPRVGVCGLGLIGGSALLGLARAGLEVRGCDVWPEPRQWCADQGIPVDGSPEATARAVDVLLVCVPPHATAPVVSAALAAAPDLIVLDAASVKGPVVDEVRWRAGTDAERFLPAHPLAGAEQGGFAAARADLLHGAPWAICPPAADPDGDASPLDALLTAAPVLDALGARLIACTAEQHDRAVAATSHAPHLVAGAVAAVAADLPTGGSLAAALSGGALRDITRVAGAPVGLWVEVLHANATATADALEATARRLQQAAAALRSGDHDRLEDAWIAGGAARDRIVQGRWSGPDWAPLAVPATWAALLALGAQGVGLRDLRPGPDGTVVGARTVGA
ncbi:prephenate dehydrogenase [Patulibacter defluvii]|uniref:prephenate dehydrogenase n=1 Tax=Patulibacter defluvii TaxID=3095358 RepID=UPI002A74C20F|nr:prephenate dehydrogenase/arogenate dehydrogenase family protein [Patulibacter sp. DM4]